MRTRLSAMVAVAALVVAACGGGDTAGTGVASLDEIGAADPIDVSDDASGAVSEEQALLDFTQCMRDNGVDIGDPMVDADGNASLDLGSIDVAQLDEDALGVARDACEGHLEGVTLGFDLGDPTELQDMALEWAQCMRDNGYDIDDPDFSGLGLGNGDTESGGPIGNPFGDVDFDDPAFQTALDACRDVLAGFGTPGAGASPTDS